MFVQPILRQPGENDRQIYPARYSIRLLVEEKTIFPVLSFVLSTRRQFLKQFFQRRNGLQRFEERREERNSRLFRFKIRKKLIALPSRKKRRIVKDNLIFQGLTGWSLVNLLLSYLKLRGPTRFPISFFFPIFHKPNQQAIRLSSAERAIRRSFLKYC